MKLSKNGNVSITKLKSGYKVIAEQATSTPGAYTVMNFKPFTTYNIRINCGSFKGKVVLWIATLKNKNIEFSRRVGLTNKQNYIDYLLSNAEHTKLKVGTLFVDPKIGNFVEIISIKSSESNQSNKKKRLAIIVPYRDREQHLKEFTPYMNDYLKNYNYQIFVVHQKNDNLFNRAALFNIGYDIVKNKFDYFSFHDIDLLPESSDYSYPMNPAHLSQRCSQFKYKKKKLFGGVILLTKEQFIKSNGFSNNFKGWGGEDDDMRTRVRRFYRIDYRPGKYRSLDHPHVGKNKNPNWQKNKNLYVATKRDPAMADKEGLNTLKYKTLNVHALQDNGNLKQVKKIVFKNSRNFMIDVDF